MTALFVFALPFILYGIGYGSYCLGCLIERQIFRFWAKLRQKRRDRP